MRDANLRRVFAPSSAFAPRPFPFAELVLLAAALSVFWLFPDFLSLATSVLITALFALSLDIALGVAGVVTLGHAMFFGLGSYTAGLLVLAGWTEPVSGALLGGLCAAALALVTGPLILRLSGLPLVMVTLAIGVSIYEAANKLGWLTGGDDGLSGIEPAPLFGRFAWSIYGGLEYLYALGWLVLFFLLARIIVASPFGFALRGIRENRLRMSLLGSSVLGHLVLAYVFSAFVAGVAGAVLAQTTKFVGLDVFSVETSIDVVIMLVLGGVGTLFGGLVGAPVYLLVKELSKEWNPHAWTLVIGFLLIAVMLFARGGIVGALAQVAVRGRPQSARYL